LRRSVDERIREWAEKRRLPQSLLESWRRLASDDSAALLGIVEALPIRTGQFTVMFALLEEIAVRDGESLAAILSRAPLRRIVDGDGSGPAKAAALLDALRVLRYPRLEALKRRLSREVGALGLPAGVRVALPPDLSSDELRIELVAHGSRQLAGLIDALSAARDALGRVADALGGADDL